ncbi:ketose-bisphosphate aldolase, partial [Shigella dysenteriae]
MSEENKENGFNHVKTFTKIIFIFSVGNDSNLLIVFYVQIMPD